MNPWCATSDRSFFRFVAAASAVAAIVAFATVSGRGADAATVTASYEHGRADVIINGYGTAAMGTFRLTDGDDALLALCVEADVPHSTGPDAYRRVDTRVASAELDALLWWLDRQPSIDDDSAVAASALTWYYAGARRSNGLPVWADGTRSFAPISPETPVSWDALAPFSMSHPVGLVVPGTHLDAAERRVVELHRLATQLSGTWALDVTAQRGRATGTLTVGGTPLAGQPVSIRIRTGDATETVVVSTDDAGVVSVDLPAATDGLDVDMRVDAPGPHQEWDGDGAVQRLATPTTVAVTGSARLEPSDGYLVISKQSTDPTIAVGGATFELLDANDAVVATGTTDVDGRVEFGPVDRTRHPAPYTVVETAAPPGLVAASEPVVVNRLSVDPATPTVVTVTNDAATASLVVRKQLEPASVGPSDRRGFEFVARRRSDGVEHHLVTGTDGATRPVALALGEYDVCEVSVPPWAVSLIDTGCRPVTVGLDELTTELTIDYVNRLPEPTIDTRATDAIDGDQSLPTGAVTVVDRVTLSGLVPHTTYRLRGALVNPLDGAPSGDVGWAEFTADATEAIVDVDIAVDEAQAGALVVVEELYVGDVVIARHADLADADQTVTIVAPTTTTTTTTATTTATTTTTPTAPTTTTTSSLPPTTTSTSTTSTSTTSTTSSTVPAITTTVAPPASTPPPTLPATGSDAAATALRLGDLGFLVGVGLFAVAGLVPSRRRPARDEAGR